MQGSGAHVAPSSGGQAERDKGWGAPRRPMHKGRHSSQITNYLYVIL